MHCFGDMSWLSYETDFLHVFNGLSRILVFLHLSQCRSYEFHVSSKIPENITFLMFLWYNCKKWMPTPELYFTLALAVFELGWELAIWDSVKAMRCAGEYRVLFFIVHSLSPMTLHLCAWIFLDVALFSQNSNEQPILFYRENTDQNLCQEKHGLKLDG